MSTLSLRALVISGLLIVFLAVAAVLVLVAASASGRDLPHDPLVVPTLAAKPAALARPAERAQAGTTRAAAGIGSAQARGNDPHRGLRDRTRGHRGALTVATPERLPSVQTSRVIDWSSRRSSTMSGAVVARWSMHVHPMEEPRNKEGTRRL